MAMFLRALGVSACLALAACSSTTTGSGDAFTTSATGGEGSAQKEKKAAELARCAQPLGTVTLVEKDIPALDGTGLTSPSTVMRLMITQSNCFQIVDADHPARKGKRGAAVADYFLTADVISKNENAGGIDGGVGRLIPGQFGQIAGSVSVKVQEAQVAIYLTNSKGVQIAATTGKASTADTGFDFARATGRGIGGGGAYANTEIGKTITAAFADAYANLVRQAQAQPPQQVARAPAKR
jgi:hypothetical protein